MVPVLDDHFSLAYLQSWLDGRALPPDVDTPRGDVDLTYTVLEFSSSGSSVIEGSLSLSTRSEGGLAYVEVTHESPQFWSHSVVSQASIVCRDDLQLRPLRWTVSFQAHGGSAPIEGTAGTARGWITGDTLHHDSVDRSEVALATDVPVTSSWTLLLSLPRLVAAGTQRTAFTLLEELQLVRPAQVLESFGRLRLQTTAGERTLSGWRHWGTGTPPIHYWTTPTGWPLLVCGLRRCLVARSLSITPSAAGG